MAVSKKHIIKALYATGGLKTHAAEKVGITYRGMWKRINEDPELQEACEDAKEQILDLAESKLYEKIAEKDLGAICFSLKCLGKQRGYIEKQQQEITGKDGGAIEISDTERASRLASLLSTVQKRAGENDENQGE